MGDRQRNFAQYATALNQYANFNNDGDRSGREREGVSGTAPGSSSSGSTSSSSSSNSGGGASHGGASAAGNAAIWGELSRSLQYNNYPGFGSAWQGGGGDMRLYGYGGYGEGQVDGRGEMRAETRGEGRRVPSKGETKATPPLPPGMAPGVGSALASLQQLVSSGGDPAAVYRSLLAARQYAAAAAALGALPTPPPASLNPAALHAASALSSHHQQQQHQQQRRQQQQQQQQHHQQMQQQQLQQQQAAAYVAAAAAGLNGEGLGMHGASRMQQPSPQGRKCTPVPPDVRHDEPLPSPGRTRSHPPPIISNQEVVCTPIMGKAVNEPPISMDSGDISSDGRRVQSGSESEGDQRVRHRRKQEQPRRQSVIYPVAMQSESGGGGDSSSDDSQGYDVLLSRNTGNERRDSPHDSVHSNSPVDPALRLPREAFQPQAMSQAMSHALAHPFLAAHLNASQLLQVAQTTPPPPPVKPLPDVPSAPSPHSQLLQVRTDLLEPNAKEMELNFNNKELPRSPFAQPQVMLPEIEIRSVRTPPVNSASLESSPAAPVKKRRCSPSYLGNDTIVSDNVSRACPLNSEVGRSEIFSPSIEGGGGMRGKSASKENVSELHKESTAHNILNTLSPIIESTPPVNGISASSEEVAAVDKNIDRNSSVSSSNISDCKSSLNVNTMPSVGEPEKVLLNNSNVEKNDQDLYNGDNEMLYSPRRRNRKRKSESEAVMEENLNLVSSDGLGQLDENSSSVESKRRTRQKRAISYVEDGTDPVLEMNEDPSPDSAPMKKKGRRAREVREKVDNESMGSPDQSCSSDPPLGSPLPPPPPPPPPPPQPPLSPQDDSSPGKTMHNSPTGVARRGRGLYRGSQRGRGKSTSPEFSSVTEPLHVDTTITQEPDLRVPGPPPIAPSSCSPDVYDFNDTDSDGTGRGKKGKRGRKKGFSPKKNNKSPIELAKSSISPRTTRESSVKSPKSPRFFSSSRSPVTERNKEWMRGLSPPVRDLSKAFSDASFSENSNSALNHASLSSGETKATAAEALQNSESCDSLLADSSDKPDSVASPRRSSRRAKPRELENAVPDFKDDSSDLSLQSLPCNSKSKTSFSGSVVGGSQSSEEKGDKNDESSHCGTDAFEGSPSNCPRRRSRRSSDQNELIAFQAQVHNEELAGIDEKEASIVALNEGLPNTKTKVKKLSGCGEDTTGEGGGPASPQTKSRRGRKPKSLAAFKETSSEGVPEDMETGRGKTKYKKRKRKFTRMPKGWKKKREPEVLPELTKQYQDLVPENSLSVDAMNSDEKKGPVFGVNSQCLEDKVATNTSDNNITSDIKPKAVLSEEKKPENLPLKSKAKSFPEAAELQDGVLSTDSCSVVSGEGSQEAVSNPASDKIESVIAQKEGTESRGRRLRARRGSAKQEKLSETDCTKPHVRELECTEYIKGSNYVAPDMDASPQKGEELRAHISAMDSKETMPQIDEGKDNTQNTSDMHHISASEQLRLTRMQKSGTPPDNFERRNSFDGQFKAFIGKDDSISGLPSFPVGNEEIKIYDAQGNAKPVQGLKVVLPSPEIRSLVTEDMSLSSSHVQEPPKTEPKSGELELIQQQNFPQLYHPETSFTEAKMEVERAPAPCTKAEEGDKSKEFPQNAPLLASEDEKASMSELVQSEGVCSLTDFSQACDVIKDTLHGGPNDLVDVPESVLSMAPPPDALEIPQGTDMDVDAETVENIAKFLEETASSIPGASEENLGDKRPKRSSRPPRKMDDNEMNELLMLLNMEDEESEDEDYVPKDLENTDSTAESDGRDSDVNDDDDDESDDDDDDSRGGCGSTLSNLLEMASDIAGDNDKMPSQKYGKGGGNSKTKKNSKSKKYKGDSSNNKKGKMKGKGKGSGKGKHEDDYKKRCDEGKKKGEGGERKGPFIRVEPRNSGEFVVNTPYRDEDEQDKQVRKANIHFHCKIEAKQKTAKVGYNSTLHNNYDAFSKDTSWFCAFCKNYSHTWKLGDLFGPYFIEGLQLEKKKYPKVIEGQVVESSSPNEMGRLKKRPPRRESASEVGDNKKLEVGGSSPPWRFVPAATPARMLVRPGVKDGATQPAHDHPNPISTSNNPKESTSGDSQTPAASTAEDRPPGTECWVHESCLLWSPGVHISNSRLCGLEDAVVHAQDSICTNCNEAGSTVGCLGKGCSLMAHVPCANQLHWMLDYQTFRSFCPKHSTPT